MSNNCGKTYEVNYGTENPCELTSASCTIMEEAIAYLGLPANTPMNDVIMAILLSLQDARMRITVLEN